MKNAFGFTLFGRLIEEYNFLRTFTILNNSENY